MNACREIQAPADARTTLLHALCDGWGRSAAIFSGMFDVPVSFGEPIVRDVQALAVQAGSVAAAMEFSGVSSGLGVLSVSRATARTLVAAMLGCSEISDEVVPLLAPTVLELANIVLNSIVGDLGDRLCEQYRFSIPTMLQPETLRSYEASSTTIGLLKGWTMIAEQPPAALLVGVVLCGQRA